MDGRYSESELALIDWLMSTDITEPAAAGARGWLWRNPEE